jgi:pyruvate dehydrogenase E2 component (dihydrolipoamide acetyltransferase)
VEDGAKNVPVNSLIAVIGEEGDDISGADAIASEAENEAPPAKEEKEEAPKEEEKNDTESKPKDEKPKKEEPAESSKSEQTSSTSSSSSSGDRIFASPIARRIAQEKGVPLDQIKGSGPSGRIVKADVEAYKAPAPSASSPSPSTSKKEAQSSPSPSKSSPASESTAQYTDTPVSSMRKVIASRLTESKQQMPHYYVSMDIEMDKVLRLRQLFNDASEAKAGGDATKAKEAKLSVGDFITKAAGVALTQVPEVNAAWYGDFIRQHHTADISIAVSTPTGLITPIVKNVGGIGLASISSATKSLAAKARQGKLQPQEYQGGSFTISNMGMYGVSHFTAIINAPQCAILAIAGTEAKIVVDESNEKGWRKAMVMQATISADHRIVDGALAARWMKAFKEALENPLR